MEIDLACRSGAPWFYVGVFGADGGGRHALRDVGEAPQYPVPTRAFQAQEIICNRLHLLVSSDDYEWDKHPVHTGRSSGCNFAGEGPLVCCVVDEVLRDEDVQ